MKYMLLLHNRSEEDSATPLYGSFEEEMAAHNAFSSMVSQRGGTFHGEALEGPETARSIRKNGDEFVVTDGPFADVKEQIGGYYVLEAADIDEAVELAKHCPAYAGIEVRPIWDIPGM